jgi:predicted TPR repeat methyltransferase
MPDQSAPSALDLIRQGRPDEAEALCKAMVSGGAADASTFYALGRIALGRGDEYAAEKLLRETVVLDPNDGTAWYRLAQVTRDLRGERACAAICDEWLMNHPGNPVAAHLNAAMCPDASWTRATDDYVRVTFDEMAPDYERVMEALSYCGPMLIEAGLSRTLGEPTRIHRVLDGGCGTGLCAPQIREWAASLHGVDLSSQMLVVAGEGGLYDELHCRELVQYLRSSAEDYDAIVMADVLVYLGAPQEVLSAAYQALRPGGALVFTAECSADEGPALVLGASGRFAHNPTSLEGCARIAGFDDVVLSDAPLRTENGELVSAVLGTAVRLAS